MRPAIDWTPELEESICAAIAITAKGLDEICEENKTFPSPRSIYTRLIQSDEFLRKYTRARDLQQQLLADQILPIADKDRICEKVTIKSDGTREVVILDQVDRSRLQIDTRKWLLSKLNPKKYGDRQQVDVSGELGIKTVVVPAPAKSDAARPEPKPEFEGI